MANAKKDNNKVPVIMGVLNTDGATPTMIEADPSTHSIEVSDGTTGSDLGSNNAARDANGETVLMAVSDVDGSTPVPLYVSSNGELLIQTT